MVLQREAYLTGIEEHSAATAAAVRADPDAPVAACPGWSARDLLVHLGTVQRLHGSHVARGEATPPPRTRPTPPDAAAPIDAVADWFAAGTAGLLAALSAVADDTPAWNWSGTSQVASFWTRRMAQEVLVHRFDAETAGGRRSSALDPQWAADGVDEFLSVFLPLGLARRPAEASGLVRVRARLGEAGPAAAGGTVAEWTVRVEPSTAHVLPLGTGSPDAVVDSDAAAVLLGLWGRADLDVLVVKGDPAVGRAVRVAI
ncbi:MAG: hypothetical protein JWM48_196 [Mycobacterium sp.]|nr:hypothetical protein [Mycobacterium sp.]MCW2743646.1 hypothetical protein [Mycobacterium sp.]